MRVNALRIISIFLFLLSIVPLNAQISVLQERHHANGTLAMMVRDMKMADFPMKDPNNRDCALVVFHNITPYGYRFESGSGFIRAKKYDLQGEEVILVAVPQGTKRITIYHEDRSVPRYDYTFENAPLEGMQAYHIYLGELTIGSFASGSQFLKFRLTPAVDATVKFRNKATGEQFLETARAGFLSKDVPVGEYTYEVIAEDYDPVYGVVSVKGADPVEEAVALRSNFGYLALEGSDLNGAEIYIDDKAYTLAQIKGLKLDAKKKHRLAVKKKKFKMLEHSFEVQPDQTCTYQPRLEPNFAIVTIKTPTLGAKIYQLKGREEVLLGTSPLDADFEVGNYEIIARAEGYKDARKTLSVKHAGESTLELPALQARYGSLSISTNVPDATVKIDGVIKGTGDRVINNLLATTHTVEITREGYAPYSTTVTVKENEKTPLNITLSNHCHFTVGGNARAYEVYVNGFSTPELQGRYQGKTGDKVRIHARAPYGSKDVTKEFVLSGEDHFTVECPVDMGVKVADFFSYPDPPIDTYFDLGYAYSGYNALVASFGYNNRWLNLQFDWEKPLSNNVVKGDRKSYERYDYIVNNGFAIRAGVNIPMGESFGITPQLGLKFLGNVNPSEEGSSVEPDYTGKYYNYGNSGSLLLGARANLFCTRQFKIFAAADYQIPLFGNYTSAVNSGMTYRAGVSYAPQPAYFRRDLWEDPTFLKESNLFFDLGYTYSAYHAISAGLGMDFEGFNISGTWDINAGNTMSQDAHYSLLNGGTVRLGWSFPVAPWVRFSPQVGMRFVGIDDEDQSTASSLLMGLRSNFYLGKNFALFVTPEYQLAMGRQYGSYNQGWTWNTGLSVPIGFEEIGDSEMFDFGGNVRESNVYMDGGGFSTGETAGVSFGCGSFAGAFNFEFAIDVMASDSYVEGLRMDGGCDVKFGFSIPLFKFIRFTPQLGFRLMGSETSEYGDSASVWSMPAGARTDIYLLEGMSLFAGYYYQVPLGTSYTGINSGAMLRAGVSFNFSM